MVHACSTSISMQSVSANPDYGLTHCTHLHSITGLIQASALKGFTKESEVMKVALMKMIWSDLNPQTTSSVARDKQPGNARLCHSATLCDDGKI